VLEAEGYVIKTPDDSGCALLSSGLLTGFLQTSYNYKSDIFHPYLSYHNVEIIVNKGFHVLHLETPAGQRLNIINTHTQSDTEMSFLVGTKVVNDTRKEQFQQILDFLHSYKDPVLLCGDLNCERSPLSEIRFITPFKHNLLQKSTLYRTGEDIDHVAWFPRQYAPNGCEMCDFERFGPRLKGCKVFELPYSDHAPVLFDIYVPKVR
jgi:endonuclease/exonuclease/phosphatase family metal-dependent hydrolase